MDWSYVTGYFDGEGHVSCRPQVRQYRIDWYNNHLASLEAIQAFMGCGNIRGRRHKGGTATAYGLYVERSDEIRRVVPLMIPHSIIKREKLEHLLVAIAGVKAMHQWGNLAAAGVEEIRRLYWDEQQSQAQIGERFGVGQSAVKAHMTRHGIPTRTHSDAMKLVEWDPVKLVAHKQALSERRKRDWQDPVYRERQIAAMRAGVAANR